MLKFIAILIPLLILAAIGFVAWYFYMKLRFKTVSSNEALIVTGPKLGNGDNVYKDENGRYMKVIRGGGHRLRMFQHAEPISLKSFQLYIKTPKVYTEQKVGVYGYATATVKVADSLEGIVKYAEQFLGKDQSEIEHEIEKVLDTHVRAILSKMTVEDINGNLESFNEQVREIAQTELNRMGFEITSLGLSDIKDDDGYLENLGKPQVAKVKKIADIAEAENMRETEIKKAIAEEDVAKERYQREMNIAEARKEKDLKDAQILAETERERAAAEAAYELEQEQRRLDIEQRRLEIREQEKANELKLREMERENEVKLQERQVELEKQKVEVRKQQADAEYYAKTRQAKAEAEARKLEGEAEADVIRKRAAAEVEALKERAKAMNEHKEVIITEKLIEMLPQYASAISNSLSNVDSIRILDGGKGEQLQSLPNAVTNMMANMNEGLGQMTGIDLTEIIENLSKRQHQTIIKETKNKVDKSLDDKSDEDIEE